MILDLTRANLIEAALIARAELEMIQKEIAKLESEKVAESLPLGVEKTIPLEQFLMQNRFLYYFHPPRSKSVTFLKDGTLGEGSNRIDHAWRIQDEELQILNSTGDVAFSFKFRGLDKPLRQSSTPQLYSGRDARLEVVK